jgi:hypothetical protein
MEDKLLPRWIPARGGVRYPNEEEIIFTETVGLIEDLPTVCAGFPRHAGGMEQPTCAASCGCIVTITI